MTRAPYPGPRPFRREEADLFFGRERPAADLRDLVLSYRVVLLHAQSGAGKSSLVNAGLLPLLAAESVSAFRARVGGGEVPPEIAPAAIRNIYAFNALSSLLGPDADPKQLLAARLAENLPPAGDQDHLLVFDQFEEFFTAYPERWGERDDFFQQVREALRKDKTLRILFVIREDYLAELDPYAGFLPDGLRIRYRLERLREKPALDAIVEPAKRFGRSFETAAAEKLLADLLKVRVQTRGGVTEVKGEFIEPVHLQVVCQNLWAGLADSATTVTQSHVREFADVSKALAAFYENALQLAVSRTGVKEASLRRWFHTELITPAGTRGIVYMGATSTAGIPNAAVEVLENEHIVRAEPRAGAKWYELTHDRFIEPIRNSNQAWDQQRQREISRRSWALSAVAAVLLVVLTALAAGYWTNRQQRAESREVMSIVQSAERAAQDQRWDDAVRFYELALAKYTELDDRAGQVQMASRAGEIYLRQGNKQLASRSFNQALKNCRELAIMETDPCVSARLGYEQAQFGGRPASRGEALRALRRITDLDQAIDVAQRQRDPAFGELRRARVNLLKGVGPLWDDARELREYVCEHDYYVVGASERPERARDELRRWLPEYPFAQLGEPTPSGRVPIIVDFFLTCDQAREVIGRVAERHPTKPFYVRWYPGCPACQGLPGK